MTLKQLFKKIGPKRPLYLQVGFTVLAFLMMVILSYLFMSDIVRTHLFQSTESVLNSVQVQIASDLQEPRVTLGGFSQTVCNVVRDGNANVLQSYINNISDYRKQNTLDMTITDCNGVYGYFETFPEGPVFINGIHWDPPADYIPTERPWYTLAVANGDAIVETQPYVDAHTGDVIFTYSRCMYDDNGRRLGVAALDVLINNIGEYVIKTTFAPGGYGILLSQDLYVLAHPESDYIGKNLRDLPHLSLLESNLRSGENISQTSMLNYKGESSIFFSRELQNGWYLCVVSPKGPYYQSVNNMVVTLSAFGLLLAGALICVLIYIDRGKRKSDTESRHKSAFLANMSHEMRTPMNAIIGMTAIGKSASDTVRKDYCLAKIEDASNHLLGVINDILDVSKIEANKFELSPTEFNLEKMLQRVVNVVNFRVDEKKQKFMVHIDKAIPKTFIGDDQRLAQVITNLLGNAVKFTPEHGSISLDVHYNGEEGPYSIIQISVTDTGIGISPEQQEKLFESFHQAENSTTRKYGGTGLGLAISKSIVEMMGGKVWIKSDLGKGATFAFTVKLEHGTEKNHGLLAPGVNLENVRILAVDDDPDVLEYFREIAHGFNVHCDTALGGEEAFRLMEQNGNYHIYFVDWRMPEIDGIQLAGKIKAKADKNSIVIMISSAEWSSIETEAKKAGVDKFLAKPLFPSAIAEMINECLGVDHQKVQEAQIDINGLYAGRRLLLVEDVEINREIILTLLKPTLLEVDCAQNGVEAVRMFTKRPYKYDMIFMDIQMPEMDGYEATRQIRKIETQLWEEKNGREHTKEMPRIPIIAMTANVFREDVERCLNVGMNGHVGKPIDFDEVLDKLRNYIKCDSYRLPSYAA